MGNKLDGDEEDSDEDGVFMSASQATERLIPASANANGNDLRKLGVNDSLSTMGDLVTTQSVLIDNKRSNQ